jgi:hypothetical protein
MKSIKPLSIASILLILTFILLNVNFSQKNNCITADSAKEVEVTSAESFDLIKTSKEAFLLRSTLRLMHLVNTKQQFFHYTLFADGNQIPIDVKNSEIEGKCDKTIERFFLIPKNAKSNIGAMTLFTEQGKLKPDKIFPASYDSVISKYGNEYLGQYDSPQLIFLDPKIPTIKIKSGSEKRTESEQSRIEFVGQVNSLYPRVKYKELINISVVASGFTRKTPIVVTCLLNGNQIPISQKFKIWIGIFKNSRESVHIPGQIRFDRKGWNTLSCYGLDAVYSDNRNSSNHGQPSFIRKSFVYVD